jgi:hypothetical protein
VKNIRELYQALLDGKTLIHSSGHKTTLEESGLSNFKRPADWEVYNNSLNQNIENKKEGRSMKFETKFNLGDEVFIVTRGIEQRKIAGIRLTHNSTYHKQVIYTLSGRGDEIVEDKVFASKAEAAKAWLSEQDITCGIIAT